MLILSRKVGERIRIGDAIEVVVQRVSGERVTLGLAAPHDVKILRGELENYDEIVDQQPVAVERRNHAENYRAPATGTSAHGRLPR